jgi:hypothetical protein
MINRCPACGKNVNELVRVDLDVGDKRTAVCISCYDKLQPDMWINKEVWDSIDPVTPYEDLLR